MGDGRKCWEWLEVVDSVQAIFENMCYSCPRGNGRWPSWGMSSRSYLPAGITQIVHTWRPRGGFRRAAARLGLIVCGRPAVVNADSRGRSRLQSGGRRNRPASVPFCANRSDFAVSRPSGAGFSWTLRAGSWLISIIVADSRSTQPTSLTASAPLFRSFQPMGSGQTQFPLRTSSELLCCTLPPAILILAGIS
jgi:hypothetical protein